MTPVDRLIAGVDTALRTLAVPARSSRPHPGTDLPDGELSPDDARTSAALMRVNHTGEVCAQALYAGQGLTAVDPRIREILAQAGREELDHLAWTRERIEALGGRTSRLDPVFYLGSFALGALSGLAGDRWNLGFLAETERQVENHLAGHLGRLPEADLRSRAVVEQMRTDEARHADTAIAHGGEALPAPLKLLMKAAARVMTATTSRF